MFVLTWRLGDLASVMLNAITANTVYTHELVYPVTAHVVSTLASISGLLTGFLVSWFIYSILVKYERYKTSKEMFWSIRGKKQ